jgi:hypothetical protein
VLVPVIERHLPKVRIPHQHSNQKH